MCVLLLLFELYGGVSFHFLPDCFFATSLLYLASYSSNLLACSSFLLRMIVHHWSLKEMIKVKWPCWGHGVFRLIFPCSHNIDALKRVQECHHFDVFFLLKILNHRQNFPKASWYQKRKDDCSIIVANFQGIRSDYFHSVAHTLLLRQPPRLVRLRGLDLHAHGAAARDPHAAPRQELSISTANIIYDIFTRYLKHTIQM
mmetsp:Transcript_34623/g.54588  ORF Transcript_34623/g.54588 Transcript_34623/m.54588 type:complete len:200 (+) Transcript_34623:119-718(+)